MVGRKVATDERGLSVRLSRVISMLQRWHQVVWSDPCDDGATKPVHQGDHV
jgi:hypothetical protein